MIERRVRAGELLALSSGRLHQDRRGFFWMMGSAPMPNERKGDVIVVHVRGELEHHKEDVGGAESYEGILEKFRCAYEGQVDGDEDADDAGGPPKAIILCVDSPGGVVSGLNECVAELQRMRAAHPEIRVTCYVNEMATSAAYALACSCDEIVCPPSAIVGSIGVISTMISQAARDQKEGFDVRLLTSGARKADGHLHAPISDAAIAVETQRVEKLALAFFKLAGKARGMAVKKIRALQAGIFLGGDAIREGLADRLSSFTDLLAGAQVENNAPKAGGNRTDRRLNMNLTSLIKKTKAALATEEDPKKIQTLASALASYSASLEAYKKTEKHIEHTKTEEGDEEEEEDEDEEEESEEESEEKGAEDEKKASAKGAEDEKKAAGPPPSKDDDDDDEDDDEDDAKSAKKAMALVQSLTGEKGAAGRGKLRAMVMLAAKAVQDVEGLKKQAKAREKSELIASVTGKYFTPKEAKELAAMPLSEVRSLVSFAKKRGTLVHTSAGELMHPKDAKPGTEESLPKETIAMIDAAMTNAVGDKKKLRAELVEAHLKARASLNGAAERY